jgi:hypothetical protein
MLMDWGIGKLCNFQIKAIHQAAFFQEQMVYVCTKTGFGKLAIPLTAGSLLSRVIITLVPLVGLGSDQVSKSSNDASYIEVYHIDEHRGPDATLLKSGCYLSLWRRPSMFQSSCTCLRSHCSQIYSRTRCCVNWH